MIVDEQQRRNEARDHSATARSWSGRLRVSASKFGFWPAGGDGLNPGQGPLVLVATRNPDGPADDVPPDPRDLLALFPKSAILLTLHVARRPGPLVQTAGFGWHPPEWERVQVVGRDGRDCVVPHHYRADATDARNGVREVNEAVERAVAMLDLPWERREYPNATGRAAVLGLLPSVDWQPLNPHHPDRAEIAVVPNLSAAARAAERLADRLADTARRTDPRRR